MKTISALLLSTIPLLVLVSEWSEPSVKNYQLKAEKTERIVELDLSFQGLENYEIDTLELSFLSELNLGNNNFEQIPQDLESLPSLTSLNLSGNDQIDIKNAIDRLKHCSTLSKLDLANCDLAFLPYEIGKMSNLSSLDLSGNSLTELPYFVSDLRRLTHVDLSDNDLKTLGVGVSFWTNLQSINLEENDSLDLAQAFKALSYVKELEVIQLSDVRELPSEAEGLEVKTLVIKNATLMELESSELSAEKVVIESSKGVEIEPILEVVSSSENVKSLTLTNSIEKSPKRWPVLESLEALDVSNNGLKTLGIKRRDLPSLQQLNISGNALSQREKDRIQKEFEGVKINTGEKVVTDRKVDPPVAGLEEGFVDLAIDPSEAQKLKVEATTINIPKNAFVDEEGNIITTPVDIQYREYNTALDFVLSGIPMQYDSAGTSVNLETGGMFEMRASSNGEEVFMNPESPISVEMPSSQTDNDYNMYQLDDETGAWNFTERLPVDRAWNLEYEFENRMRIWESNNPRPISPKSFRFQRVKWHLDKDSKSGNVMINVTTNNRVSRDKMFIGYSGLKLFERNKVVFHEKAYRTLKKKLRKQNRKSRVTFDRWWQGLAWKDRGLNDNYAFMDYLVTIDKNKDCFHLHLMYKNEAYDLPFVLELRGDEQRSQKRIKKFWNDYLKFKTAERKEYGDSKAFYEKTLGEYEKDMDAWQSRRRAYQKVVKEEMGGEDFLEGAIVQNQVSRTITMNGFGYYNCDRPSMGPNADAAVTFYDENGDQVDVRGTYVLEGRRNAAYQGTSKVNWRKGGKCAMIVVSVLGKIALVTYQKFSSKFKGKDGATDIRLRLKWMTGEDAEKVNLNKRLWN